MMRARWLVGIGMLLLAGCSAGYKVAPVSGRITMNGDPLPRAQITFQPLSSGGEEPGPGSSAVTDDDGRYVLKLLSSGKPGAVVGRHRVMIFTYRPSNSKEETAVPVETIPACFNLESKLSADVPPEGTQTADFPLETP